MRLASLVTGVLLLAAGNAFAFECTGVKLPSNIVICSDPELTKLADERQAAINEMRGRIGEDNWSAFWENQKAWVRSYATACGVPPASSPPTPIPENVRDCFKSAALARIAYIRAYSPPGNGNQTAQAATANRDADLTPPRVGNDVPLEFMNGIYVVPVLINGVLPLRFTVDSGAADVSIPADVFLTLVRTGTIGKDDYIGTQKYRLADGSNVDSDRFLIRELKVGNQTLTNVVGSVESVKSTPLLGQTFLSKFASWSMDNERHVLVLVPRGGGTSSKIAGNNSQSPITTPLASSYAAIPGRSAEPHESLFCGQRISYVVQRPSSDTNNLPFLGAWTGTWDNPTHLCAGLIVEEISGVRGTRALYYFGSGNAMRSKSLLGLAVGDNSLSFRDDEGSTFEFNRVGDNLNAKFLGKSGILTGSFHRAYTPNMN
jgi:predicted aspartyl protease